MDYCYPFYIVHIRHWLSLYSLGHMMRHCTHADGPPMPKLHRKWRNRYIVRPGLIYLYRSVYLSACMPRYIVDVSS